MTPILQCTGLCKKFGKKTVLDNVSFALERGQIVGLLGPNGSGKSTLIKLANGLLTPTEGDVTIDGETPGIITHAKVSYLPERSYLSNWMTANDLLNFFESFYDNFNREKAEDMLARLQIAPESDIKTMSKGTKEKVQLVMVMSREADLYLLDEPIGGVDPAARDYILDTILTNYNENSTIVLSTHLIADIEKVLDDVLFLNQGEIVLHKSVDDIRAEHGKSVDALFREVFAC
ncbi:MAG: ABC transporter ATP-binding protein [Eubacteriales bacterium]|nr:ABC transporter ATP-binding protein [Eubacteriales bacterium]